MTLTHSQAQRQYDNMEPNEGQEEEEMDYVQETAKEVLYTYYPELHDMLFSYDVEIDYEDWLNEKTHFKYVDKQWVSHTLDLISEANELGDVKL